MLHETRCAIIGAMLALGGVTAQAQFPERVQPGVRVRVWLPEPQPQDANPRGRQLLRATVSGVGTDTLLLDVPGTLGNLTVARANIRRLDISRGTNRVASAFERALGFAIGAAITAALENDPDSTEWPHYDSYWRAAGEGAKWGAALGAVVGFVFPTERWRRVQLR